VVGQVPVVELRGSLEELLGVESLILLMLGKVRILVIVVA
jgi:hypothetical protein